MTEIRGAEPDQPTFSHADDLDGSPAQEPTRAELNAELGLEDAMENAKPYFQRLVTQLKEPLQNGTYTSILGDDVTGRLPALVIAEIANKYAAQRSRPGPNQLFFAGGAAGNPTIRQAIELAKELEVGEPQYGTGGVRRLTAPDHQQRYAHRDRLLAQHIDALQPLLGERALIVTDRIWKGETIARIAEALHQRNIAFDIATLGTSVDLQELIDGSVNRPEFAGVQWFTGGDRTEDGILYTRDDSLDENLLRESIGVEKNYLDAKAKRGKNFDMTKVRAAREYLAEYSADLYRSMTV